MYRCLLLLATAGTGAFAKYDNVPRYATRAATFAVSAPRSILGSNGSPYGQIKPEYHAETGQPLVGPWYFHRHRTHPVDQPVCQEMIAKSPLMKKRLEEKLAGKSTGNVYYSMVDHPEDLAVLTQEQLTCLLFLGRPPPQVPKGFAFGWWHDLFGSTIYSEMTSAVWGGKILTEIPCPGSSPLPIAVNHVFGVAQLFTGMGVGLEFNGKKDKIAPQEYLDDEGWWWIDYSLDFKKMCPSALLPEGYGSVAPKVVSERSGLVPGLPHINKIEQQLPFDTTFLSHKETRPMDLGFLANPWPYSTLFDQIRWVGRDWEQSTDIYLGRTLYDFKDEAKVSGFFTLAVSPLLKNVTVIRDY